MLAGYLTNLNEELEADRTYYETVQKDALRGLEAANSPAALSGMSIRILLCLYDRTVCISLSSRINGRTFMRLNFPYFQTILLLWTQMA